MVAVGLRDKAKRVCYFLWLQENLKIQLHLVRDLKEEKETMNISVELYCRQDILSLQKPLVYLFITFMFFKKEANLGRLMDRRESERNEVRGC